MKTPQVNVNNIGLPGALFLVFLVLKLVDKIDWSWWWVTAPLWGPFAIYLAVLGAMLVFACLCFLLAGVVWLFTHKKRKAQREALTKARDEAVKGLAPLSADGALARFVSRLTPAQKRLVGWKD